MFRVSFREKKLIEYKAREANENTLASYVRNRALGRTLPGFHSDKVTAQLLVTINNAINKVHAKAITEEEITDLLLFIKSKIHGD